MRSNIRSHQYFSALAFVAGVLSTISVAQANEDCSKALVPNVIDMKSNVQLFSSYLKTIDEIKFQEAKRDAGLQAAFIVYDIPFDITASYGEFDKARSKYFEKIQFKQSHKDSSTYLMQEVPDKAFETYSQCLLTNSKAVTGPHLIPLKITGSSILLRFNWQSPAGLTNGTASWGLSGLTTSTTLPKKIPSNGSYDFVFERAQNKDASVTVNVEGAGDSFLLPYVAPIQIPKPTRAKYVKVRNYQTEGMDRQQVDVMCPSDYHLLEKKGTCILSVPNVALIENSAIGNVGWHCKWASWQAVGIALDVQATCELDEGKE